MNTGHPSIEGQLPWTRPTAESQAGTHASRLGLCSRSGGRGVFLAGGDTAAPEGLFSRRQGLEPGLTRAMVPCSWLEILWDACVRGQKAQVSQSTVCPRLQGAPLNWDTSPHQWEQDRQILRVCCLIWFRSTALSSFYSFFQEIFPSCTLYFLSALICSAGSFASPLKS